MTAPDLGGLTWQELRDLDLSGVGDAADGWRGVGGWADSARTRVDNEMTAGLRETQRGEAERAAVKRLVRLSENFRYIHVECGMVRTSLDGLAAELRPVQKSLRDALAEAESRKFTVHDDGTVGYPAAGKDLLGQVPEGGTARESGLLDAADPLLRNPNPNHERAQDIADRIGRAVKDARRIDAEYATALRKLRAGPGLSVTDAMWTDAAGDLATVRKATDDHLGDDIPEDASPAERKEWWDSLGEEQRERYLAVYPDRIGNLDGIPSEVRDKANRTYLPLLMGKLEASEDERARTKLQGLEVIDRELREGSHPPMLLLGIGDQGNGRAIVSYGNPDTAKNVAAYVPGLGTALDRDFATNDLKRARDTAIGAQKYDPSSAAIVWLGYDAPQLPAEEAAGNAAVMSPHHARAGAPAYNSFMSGVSATNENADPHVTAIGHSYGSLTVGQAAQRPGGIPGADDIILIGSPGTGAEKAEDLNVGKGNVYVGAAENDPVTKLPSRPEGSGLLKEGAKGFLTNGPLGGVLGGVRGYVLGDVASDDEDVWFGTDPASEEFGAKRFKVDDGPRPFVDGEGPTPAHSNYFNPGKDQVSADNIAVIVAGQPEKIMTEDPR
ncbi:alpha/beta hydrolase [Streptomyces glaucosporus]|uniref:Alpha/beta hydrolase n=1 Tax=Streptomyces glaucosporus TaxID=284044 RepID=A0ABP5VB06_9ACTN